MNIWWTISESELYSIKVVRSADVFEKSAYQGGLFTSKFGDPGRRIRPKDIVSEMREQHGIHLMYNKAYSLKEHALNQVFSDPWESFQRSIICIDATHLKARTRGVLLVALCKDENEMIYPLAFSLDQYNGIFNAMEAIFPYAAHGICAYSLAQNLKRFCKQRDDVIWLYYSATYAYHIEEFDRAMAELKETYRKVYDELLGAGVEKFSRVHSPRKWYFLMTTNIAESMNSCLLAVRKLPITAMAEFIRDLSQSQWDLDELLCSHAMAVTSVSWPRFKGVSINTLASEFYTTRFLKHAYEMGVIPVPDPKYWDISDAIWTYTVLPWKKKNLPERPKK
ncbi:hypothetical protein Dsin_024695 [Dipteronia sinensis]|uniref:MULE transposase domain-containing protein n=1 Tax=Dipteronia sinensis TaxID=43782 RepID=A0AAD9ZU88_9ROSI|nr:hypothetical protein Dsin_024695 [Dipteronia sinensis]